MAYQVIRLSSLSLGVAVFAFAIASQPVSSETSNETNNSEGCGNNVGGASNVNNAICNYGTLINIMAERLAQFDEDYVECLQFDAASCRSLGVAHASAQETCEALNPQNQSSPPSSAQESKDRYAAYVACGNLETVALSLDGIAGRFTADCIEGINAPTLGHCKSLTSALSSSYQDFKVYHSFIEEGDFSQPLPFAPSN
ncbi:hypothetical protein [Cognatiyoonia sp. IB215182]|uniref:hypothetical protein n=1 Tax=Cognatiyoonia sp. IB215182 TaxID=3097353 RepID=UPI002A12DC06|nr:hypothetical protein [Cognatiyoonia sp. IB215182]MDX8355551.1 hypothetical protein [Cognatiyoonia sp. IB215182]